MEIIKKGDLVRVTKEGSGWRIGEEFVVDHVSTYTWGTFVYANEYQNVDIKKIELVSRSQIQNWISVKERMPDENVGVLVFIPEEDYHVTSGMWDVSQKWVLLDEYRIPTSEVTHWMPSPDISQIKDTPYTETEVIEDRNIEIILDSHYPNTRTIYREAILKAMEEYKDWFIARYRMDIAPEHQLRRRIEAVTGKEYNNYIEFEQKDRTWRGGIFKSGHDSNSGVVCWSINLKHLEELMIEAFVKWDKN